MTAFLIITALILLNGIFVAAEFAIVGAPRAAIERLAATGHRLARAVHRVLEDPQQQDRYIATAQLGITLASLGLGMYGEHVLADRIFAAIGGHGLPEWAASNAVASVAAVAILTYFHIVIGEMVPKSLALQHAERMVLWITRPMLWARNALYPFVVGLNAVGNVVLRMLGVDRRDGNPDQYYTPEELQWIVQESEDLGVLRAESGQMLQELFAFGDRTAGEVMVPRVRVTGIPVGATPDQIRELLGRLPHTRYPVYEGDLDHIVGMVHIKDLLGVLLREEAIAQSHARPLPLVPEGSELDGVLSTMRREQTQMVIVLDEHGGTAGVITLQDLFEEVVGEIEEGPANTPEVHRDADGRLRVPGTLRIDELGQELGLELEHEDVDSVSGLVLMLLGRPALVGDTVRYGRVVLEVTAVKGHGVGECAVSLSQPT
ncbi:MAG: hemolysin family protein [Acidobacteriota bacterium]